MTKLKVGYDIDGVLCQDIAVLKSDTLINRVNYQPFFNPPHPWVAITGRPPIDKNATMEWFRRYFKNPPQEIYFNTTFKTSDPHNGAQHKAETINKLGLTLYIESCHQQAKEIQDLCPSTLVIQFSDLVEQTLDSIYNIIK